MSPAYTTCCSCRLGSIQCLPETQGFKKTVLGPFTLEVNQIARVDIKLEVGETTQSVEIKDFAPILQTESTQTGDTLSARRLTSIPLNGRNFASLTHVDSGRDFHQPECDEHVRAAMQGRAAVRR